MKTSRDEEVKQILQSRFESFEVPVDDNLWIRLGERIALKPGSAVGQKILYLVILGAFILSTSISFYRDSKEPGYSRINPYPISINSGDRLGIKLPNKNGVNVSIVSKPALEIADKECFDPIVITTSPKTIGDEFELTMEREVISTTGTGDIEQLMRQSGVFRARKIDMATRFQGISDAGLPSKEIVGVKHSKRYSMTLTNGFSLNYLRFQPKTGDSILFNRRGNVLNVSPRRIGFQPRLALKVPLNSRLHFSSAIGMQFQQYQFALEYELYNRFGELIDNNSIREDFSVVMTAIGVGLNYSLDHRSSKTLDISLDYRRNLKRMPETMGLIGFHKDLINLHFSMSYYFNFKNRLKWVIQPYGDYAINRKRTSSPMQLIPYSFGVGFGVEFK